MDVHPATGLSGLSEVLWRERETLELVLFKLEEQRLLLVDGQARWVSHASRELEVVLDQLGAVELTRAMASTTVAAELGVSDECGLRELVASAPAPWPSVIGRHVGALLRLAEEIIALAAGNRLLLDEGLAEVRRGMGRRCRRPSITMLVDSAAFHAALATNDRVLQPSLVDAVTG